ncbi:MAG: extracellular solute-binding protein [Nitriliruptorales bacterium]|nr:extracellular solute-binding protein [Nitriliruptorales bacterium]
MVEVPTVGPLLVAYCRRVSHVERSLLALRARRGRMLATRQRGAVVMRFIPQHLGVVVLLAAVALACNTPTAPTGDAQTESEQAAGGEQEDLFAEVFAELEGLEGQERTDKLQELASEEGALNVYTSNTDLAEFAEAFTDTYDIDVSVYRAPANTVLQRLLQEAEAGFAGADLYDSNAEELATAHTEGLLREYEGPASEGLVEVADQEGWVGSRLNVFTVSWNTDVIDEPPTSYQDLADERFSGQMMMEPRAFEWYMALSAYFTEEEGMSQEEVDQMFSDMASNSVLVEGNTTHAQFLGAGEYGLSTSVYNHLVDELTDSGAPVTREPPVEPIVVRPNGIGLLNTAQNPASAVLLFEWLLTEGQELLADEFRVPAREELQSEELADLNTIDVDVDQLVEEGTDWEERYEEVLRGSQGTIEEEE